MTDINFINLLAGLEPSRAECTIADISSKELGFSFIKDRRQRLARDASKFDHSAFAAILSRIEPKSIFVKIFEWFRSLFIYYFFPQIWAKEVSDLVSQFLQLFDMIESISLSSDPIDATTKAEIQKVMSTYVAKRNVIRKLSELDASAFMLIMSLDELQTPDNLKFFFEMGLNAFSKLNDSIQNNDAGLQSLDIKIAYSFFLYLLSTENLKILKEQRATISAYRNLLISMDIDNPFYLGLCELFDFLIFLEGSDGLLTDLKAIEFPFDFSESATFNFDLQLDKIDEYIKTTMAKINGSFIEQRHVPLHIKFVVIEALLFGLSMEILKWQHNPRETTDHESLYQSFDDLLIKYQVLNLASPRVQELHQVAAIHKEQSSKEQSSDRSTLFDAVMQLIKKSPVYSSKKETSERVTATNNKFTPRCTGARQDNPSVSDPPQSSLRGSP